MLKRIKAIPIYDFACVCCGNKFQELTAISERHAPECPACGGEVKRSYEGACAFGSNAVKPVAPCGAKRECPSCAVH